ncbi:sensor histidine kinase [Paenibacillus sp. HW567]|uniref:sensor histidine kinase n=1 Tax=Paenibacillus sp. HW567 TaxID=1034769 RepID=UPI00037DB778|nr:histidine kinase [Paenibacillus sp. HW567]
MKDNLHPFRWNDLRLRNKLMILYFAAVFVPVLLTNIFFYTITADNVRSDKVKDLKQSLERNKDNFRKMVEGIISFSSVIYNDGVLYSALDQSYSSESEVLSVYSEVLNNSINRFVPLNKQFYNAYLYTDNDTLIHSGPVQFIDAATREQGWYRATTRSGGNRKWLLYTNTSNATCENAAKQTPDRDCTSSYLSVIRELDFYKAYSRYHKILKVDILPEYLESTLFDRSFPGQIYLINPEGKVIYSSEAQPSLRPDVTVSNNTTQISSTFDDVDYLKGWQMTGVYPSRIVDQSLLKSRRLIVYLTCANLLFPSIIILLISRSLNSRLGLLLSGIKRVKNQRFEILKAKPASDEIGQLTEEFNRMTEQIDGLIQDVYIAELDRRQAQFNALQSQINPHYLFNTLEAIRMNCLIKGEDETASVIKLLGRGFRRSLSWGQDLIPLYEEMDFVTDYLDIQQFRFGHRLSYELDLDDAVLEVLLPKMSILPLVENACIHGIEHSECPGAILVTAKCPQDRVIIRVHNNGLAIEPGQLQQLTGSLESQAMQGKHVGLKNVYNRLKWHFGSEFAFSILSGQEEGTTVEIQIPAMFSPEPALWKENR